MNILLTGGAGYVGSACLRWLKKHDHQPVAYDNMSEGNRAAVEDAPLVEGDILNRPLLVSTLREHRIDAVMHFAALASVPESVARPDLYWQVNVEGTRCVLEAMREAGVKLILASSTSATFDFDAPMPLQEDSAQKPMTPYGTTKLAAENMIREYAGAFGMGCALLRYFNAAGADAEGGHGECRRHEGHLIPLILHAAAGKIEKVKICGTDWPTRDGTCVRDYVHVQDLAQAHQKVIEALEPGRELIYNLGSGTGSTVLEVLRACEKVVGRAIPHETAPRRPGDPAVLVASSEKISKDLNWSPQYPRIETIVRTAWDWHSRYPDGYVSEARANVQSGKP